MSAVGSILTNTGALEALNSITNTTSTTNSLENQLSSGLSISSPADNPAGYITAQGFTSQINGISQAISNANQAVSLLQTAQSAITQQVSVVQQLNSIAVQAANGTQTPAEAQSLQGVVAQLIGQVNTIAGQTQFNNINLLDGSFKGVQFQVGANEGQTQTLSISNTEASSIGMWATSATSASAKFTAGTSGTAFTKSLTSGSLAQQLGSGGSLTITGTASGKYTTTATDGATGTFSTSNNFYLPPSLAKQIGSGTYTLKSNGTALTGSYTAGTGTTVHTGAAPASAAAPAAANFTNGGTAIGNLATFLGNGGSMVIKASGVTANNAAAAGSGSGVAAASLSFAGAAGLGSGSYVIKDVAGTVTGTYTQGAGTTTTTGSAPGAVPASFNITPSALTVTGPIGGSAPVSLNAGESASSLAAAVNLMSGTTGVQAQATTTVKLALTAGAGGFSFTLAAQNADALGNSSPVGSAIKVNAASANQIVTQINGHTSTSGITAAIDSNGNLVLTQATGANIAVTGASTAASAGTLKTSSGAVIGGSATSATASGVFQGQVQFQSSGAFNVSNLSELGVGAAKLDALSEINVSTTSGANDAINVVKYALASLGNQGGALGAVQQSLNANINNLNATNQNLTSALGVVQDANIPSVTNQLTEAEIQAQSGVAALKSSTQMQQSYLSLLP